MERENKSGVVRMIVDEVDSGMSIWDAAKESPEELDACEHAVEILAGMGHLHRFDGEEAEKAAANREGWVAERLDDLVRFGNEVEIRGWDEDRDRLEELMLDGAPNEDVRDMALRLFLDLDNASLASWYSRKLGQGLAADGDLFERRADLQTSHAWLFDPIEDYVDAMIRTYRGELIRHDFDLWDITQCYHAVSASAKTTHETDLAAIPSLSSLGKGDKFERCDVIDFQCYLGKSSSSGVAAGIGVLCAPVASIAAAAGTLPFPMRDASDSIPSVSYLFSALDASWDAILYIPENADPETRTSFTLTKKVFNGWQLVWGDFSTVIENNQCWILIRDILQGMKSPNENKVCLKKGDTISEGAVQARIIHAQQVD